MMQFVVGVFESASVFLFASIFCVGLLLFIICTHLFTLVIIADHFCVVLALSYSF